MQLNNIIFLDLEVNKKSKKIQEFGLVFDNDTLKTSSLEEVKVFINKSNSDFICGHNFIDFDLEILKTTSLYEDIKDFNIIDTLPLSLLLFNEKSIHSLPKNYKTEDDFKNNPVEDSKITLTLLDKLINQFKILDKNTQNIFYNLLYKNIYFEAFFILIKDDINIEILDNKELRNLIYSTHEKVISNKKYLYEIIDSNPIELAYILALLTPYIEIKSHPPKILYTYTNIIDIQKKLCFDIKEIKRSLSSFSNEVFGFATFRTFPRLNAGLFNTSVSQKEIVEASLDDKSFLTILPTGGGKTFTFWLPAIIKAKSYKSLTVVISPLQALIKDHIESFNSKVANYNAVAISGFMSPLARAEAIEQTINGEADILYIAPESLRSNVIFNILKNRLIERFVIDEAHCLSTWGNDFRQDYFYICDYIKELLEEKTFQDFIPISCFTATAKPSVIKDIKEYFLKGLNIKLDEHFAEPERKNLVYKSIPSSKKDKYTELLKLINEHDGATLIYIPSSTKDCDEVASKLMLDTNKSVRAFHSKLESQDKMNILKGYISNEIDIIVATTAFGMGVDKANITNVIHYEISDSLESYAQEAGRGARDEKLEAFCPILFDENDLDKHFNSLNRSKITANEINSIFRVLKSYKQDVINKTAFELASEAGWDVEDSSNDYSTKVKTALLELQREGYLSRKRNKTQFFADSIASQAMEKLHTQLDNSNIIKEEKERLVLILQSIIGRGKIQSVQIDELADILGYKKSEIALGINQLKQFSILGDSKDLNLEIDKKNINKFNFIQKIEIKLFEYISSLLNEKVSMRELNEFLYSEKLITKNQVELIKNIIKNWKNKKEFLFNRIDRQRDIWSFKFVNKENVKNNILQKHEISNKLLKIFISKIKDKKKVEIQFSLKYLHELIDNNIDIKQIDVCLLYLHHLNIIELLNGRFINYSPMQLIKEDKFNNKLKYTQNEYEIRLKKHYQTKIESIHIMGEYASRLKNSTQSAKLFLKDYFHLPYDKFKKEYNLLKKKISQPISQKRYNEIFTKMSDEQKSIVNDKKTKAMMILAGPGSGKTKVLVHKIASIILTEDVKPEQFMMLTFSKSAKFEFKSRLNSLIGALSYDIEIQTFHSYALKLIARDTKSNDEILKKAINEATKQILDDEIKLPYIAVLVLDEYQDINEDSFELIKAIYSTNKDMRIIAVGDDDQCIMGHIGANISFIDKFEEEFSKDDENNILYKRYELTMNYRSKKNIVKYTNNFINNIKNRYKQKPLISDSSLNGKVEIISYKYNDLITPILNLIQEDEENKNIVILAFTNDEVMQIYSLLKSNDIDVKYIIDRENFSLKNIIEIVDFDILLNNCLNENEKEYQEEYFLNCLEIIKNKYKNSNNIILLKKIINRFLDESDEYYISQWYSYLEEIKLEDFENFSKNIVVSTIHKSKGMEFDKVILIKNPNMNKNTNKEISKDEIIRLYYVGMTRAKNELSILNTTIPNKKDDYIVYKEDNNIYHNKNNILIYIMSLSDISLGFDYEQRNSYDLYSGTKVTIEKKDKFRRQCIVYENKIIGTLSSSFNSELENKLNNNFMIKEVTIDYVINWYDKKEGKYKKHSLCKIELQFKN